MERIGTEPMTSGLQTLSCGGQTWLSRVVVPGVFVHCCVLGSCVGSAYIGGQP
jgi:hypothetical protein